jgi:type I restriction enzyme S subunit
MLTEAFVQQSVIEDNRVAMPKINQEALSKILVAVPPLAEQRRIVAKVEELMALCDRMEAAKAAREARRDRLAAATLHALNNGAEATTFRDHARFALDHLPHLTARPEQIGQLRQTILNLAVRGKLVPQDPKDEPAAELLKRIQAEKARQLKLSELKKQQTLPDIAGCEKPFEVPESWQWTSVDDCFNVSGGIQKTPARIPKNNPHPYIGVGNVYRGRLDLSEVKQFELLEGDLERFRLEKGDILVVEGNGSVNEIGRCAVWSGEIENCVHQNHIIRCRPFRIELTPYVLKYLNSPNGNQVMKALAVTSSGLYSLSVGKIRPIAIPLPPLAEQRRIVAKVEELMALCDRLEAQLTTGQTESRRLLEATLHEALAEHG